MSLVFLDVLSEKLFRFNPRLLYWCHAIPLVNFQSRLSRIVNNHISNIHGLNMCKNSRRCWKTLGVLRRQRIRSQSGLEDGRSSS